MDSAKRVRATGIGKWIVLSLLVLSGCAWMFVSKESVSLTNQVLLVLCFAAVIPNTVFHLINSTYLTEKGIEQCRWGRVFAFLSWSEVSDVYILRDFPLSSKSSATTHIVATPKNCEKYDPTKWNGFRYLIAFRGKIIVLDDNKANREFIKQYFGEIQNLRNS